MPARELGSSLDAPNGTHAIATTLLKRHKTLPHPREDRFLNSYPSTSAAKAQDLVIDTGTSSIPSSDTSSPRTLKHTSKRIGILPPTPPTHSRQSSGSHSTIVAAPRFDLVSIKKDVPSTPGTPPNQRSPPTPDVTPPRAMPLSYRPRDRYPSSRTDSFKTARENPYSSDEDEVLTVRPGLPSAKTSATEVPQMQKIRRRVQKRKEVGLGLGLESDNEGTPTPKPTRPDNSQEEFVVFDGEWGSTGDASEVEREWDDNLMRNVVVRKRPNRSLHLFTTGAGDEVLEDHIVTPTMATKIVRNMPLQDRIARHRLAKDSTNRASAENFAERIAWPQPAAAQSRQPAEAESPFTSDVRRFSTTSGPSVNSTVIEAMVLDAPPTRRKTLRHTKKQVALRDLGSDQSTRSSGPDSVASSEPRQRLHHSSARLPERKHKSVTSNTTVSTTSSSGLSRKAILKSGAIPVVVIPERRNSLKSSKTPSLRSTSSRRTKRSQSLNSAPLSQSSKYNEPGYFSSHPPRKRTMSESAGSGHSVRTIDYPPSIPVRRSSLSAPTSRNTSRANSLTAESLEAHNKVLLKKQEAAVSKPVSPPHLLASSERDFAAQTPHRSNVDHNGDPFFGNRLSTQVTPFSQASYETAGTMAEVSEAFAVTIFPHQNKSVLVVQHTTPPDLTLPPIQTTAPSMALNGTTTTGPVTPPQPIHPMDEVDSPLRNPRDPPEPPAIKFIPATPSGLTPSVEEERQLGYGLDDRPATSADVPKRTMSLVRRFSNRRGSETAAQRPSFLSRTFSLSGKRKDESTQTSKPEANLTNIFPSVADKPADGTKLHPFWRPAHFWDDLEDQDDSDDERDYLRYPLIDNRPHRTFSQKLKRTFAILPISDDYIYQPYATDRRTVRRTPSEKLRVVKQRSDLSLRREAASGSRIAYTAVRPSGPAEGEFGYGFKEGNGGKSHIIPGLGLRVEYVGWSGMKRRLSERRREQRSEKLRQSISGPRGVRNGTDDVLRRRGQV
jgi:hypothetical protein